MGEANKIPKTKKNMENNLVLKTPVKTTGVTCWEKKVTHTGNKNGPGSAGTRVEDAAAIAVT